VRSRLFLCLGTRGWTGLKNYVLTQNFEKIFPRALEIWWLPKCHRRMREFGFWSKPKEIFQVFSHMVEFFLTDLHVSCNSKTFLSQYFFSKKGILLSPLQRSKVIGGQSARGKSCFSQCHIQLLSL
jgi:hypothetical protein